MYTLLKSLAVLLLGFMVILENAGAQERGNRARSKPKPAKVSLHIDQGPLAFAARQAAEVKAGSIVLMNGVASRMVGPFDFGKDDWEEITGALAKAANCEVAEGKHYHFVYPTGDPAYETLSGFTFGGSVDSRLASKETTFRFGADIPLYNALALLGHTLGVTLVADNAVADTLSGEVILDDAPLGDVLDALCKSARIARETVAAEGDATYVFIRSIENVSKQDLLTNENELDAAARERLEAKVDVSLPAPPKDNARFEAAEGPVTLASVLATLSAQLGVPVTADRGLEKLPVNPVVMRDIPARTAINLLIRQWPVAKFAWSWIDGGVRLVYLGA